MIEQPKIKLVVFFNEDNTTRFLVKHDKPQKNREQGWSLIEQSVLQDEKPFETAHRIAKDLLGNDKDIEIQDTNYEFRYDSSRTVFYFFSVKLINSIKVTINMTTIGYDFKTLSEIRKLTFSNDDFMVLKTKNR